MRKIVTITQSNYMPWKGYFNQAMLSDVFIFLDCVQYTKRDWRNRNKIKTPQGTKWLSVPVNVKGRYHQPIDEVEVASDKWSEKHILALQQNYIRTPFYAQESSWVFEQIELAGQHRHLSPINQNLFTAFCQKLEINTELLPCNQLISREHLLKQTPTARLVELCRSVKATHYLTGPSAKNYLDMEQFFNSGIEVIWMSYNHYPEYPQPWGTFVHQVSIIDLLFNIGSKNACHFIQPKPWGTTEGKTQLHHD